VLGYVRSATSGQVVDLSNCQPFEYQRLVFIMVELKISGRHSIDRSDRLVMFTSQLKAVPTQNTLLLIDELQANPVARTSFALLTVDELAKSHQLVASANMLVVEDIALSLVLPPARSLSTGYGTIQPSQRLLLPNLCFGNWNLNRAFSVWEKTLRSRSINCKDVTNSVSTNTLSSGGNN